MENLSTISPVSTMGLVTADPFAVTMTPQEIFRASLYYAVVFGLGVSGNSLSFLVARRVIKHRNGLTDFLISFLSLSDLLCIILVHPFSVLCMIYGRWLGGRILCAYQYYVTWSSLKTSFLILVIFTIDRYLALVRPFTYRAKWTYGFVKKLIAGTFLFSYGSTLLTPLLQSHTLYPLENWFICLNTWSTGDPYDGIILLFYGLTFIIGVTVIIVCNIRTSVQLWKARRKRKHLQSHPSAYGCNPSSDPNSFRRTRQELENRIATMVMILTALFSVSWTPWLAFIVLRQAVGYSNLSAEEIAIRIVFSNSVLNPFIYGAISRTYRRGYIYFVQILFYKLSCRFLPKPNDLNIFYIKNNWLQRQEARKEASSADRVQPNSHEAINPQLLQVRVEDCLGNACSGSSQSLATLNTFISPDSTPIPARAQFDGIVNSGSKDELNNVIPDQDITVYYREPDTGCDLPSVIESALVISCGSSKVIQHPEEYHVNIEIESAKELGLRLHIPCAIHERFNKNKVLLDGLALSARFGPKLKLNFSKSTEKQVKRGYSALTEPREDVDTEQRRWSV